MAKWSAVSASEIAGSTPMNSRARAQLAVVVAVARQSDVIRLDVGVAVDEELQPVARQRDTGHRVERGHELLRNITGW
jgi:hypothetical protein